MNLRNRKLFTSKFVGTGPSSYEKRIYRAAVSQRLRVTELVHPLLSDGVMSKNWRRVLEVLRNVSCFASFESVQVCSTVCLSTGCNTRQWGVRGESGFILKLGNTKCCIVWARDMCVCGADRRACWQQNERCVYCGSASGGIKWHK
jgi:hypothetical protein